MAEKRKLILDSLRDIPEMIGLAYDLRKASGVDKCLEELELNLHYALIDAIEVMIAWLIEKSKSTYVSMELAEAKLSQKGS